VSGVRHTVRRGVLGAVAALLLTGTLLATAATAQVDRSASEHASSLTMDVTRLDGLVTAETDLRIRAQVRNGGRFDREDLRLLVTVHRQPIGRFNYQQALDEGVLGDVIHAFTAEAGEIPASGTRTVELSQTAAELGLARPAGQEGVYPLRIQLQSGGTVVDELISNVVYLPGAAELPIAVSVLTSLAHAPTRDGQGVFADPRVIEAVGPSGGLRGVVDVLEARPDAPVALGVDGLTLEEAADLASGFMQADGDGAAARASDSPAAEHAAAFLEALREVAARPAVQLLTLPYASADLVALDRHGLGAELDRHVIDGYRALEATTADRPLRTMLWPPDGLNGRTLERLDALGFRTHVLSERYLELTGPRGPRSPAPVRQVRAGRLAATALVPDPWLEQTLGAELPTALLAQRILGELATVYFEAPSIAGRAILLAPPLDEPLAPDLLAALLDGVAAAPFADLVTLATLSQRTAPAEDPVRLDYPGTARINELPAAYVGELRRARGALRSLEGILVDDPVSPARFDQTIMQAASVHYREQRDAGRALVQTVTGRLDDLHDAVEIPPVPPVTLTNVEGQLPVTIESQADVTIRVLLHLRTASYEIEGGPVRELVLEPEQAQILSFRVRALRPGRTDGVQLLVTDPSGTIELADATVVVRATTFSVAGVVVTLGAALFLLAWGVRETARRRNRRGEAPAQAAREPVAARQESRRR
jgi:hypothetical protein